MPEKKAKWIVLQKLVKEGNEYGRDVRFCMADVLDLRYDDIAAFSDEFQEFLKLELLKKEGKIIPLEKDNVPLVDIFCNGGDVVIEVELPGVSKDDLEVTFINPFVFIKGSKGNKFKKTKVNYICMECSFGSFQRIVEVPYPVNSTKSKAACKDGVLTVSFPIVSNRRVTKKKISLL